MKQERLRRAARIITSLFYLATVGLLLREALHGHSLYRMSLLAAALALPLAPRLLYRLCGLRRLYVVEIGLQIFVLGSVICGSVLGCYRSIPHFDKVMHTIAGVLLALIGLAVYYWGKSGRQIEPADAPQTALFAWMFSLSSAAVWEIYEFFLSFFMRSDPQRVVTTGVGDTMWDIIVCMLGGTITAVSGYRYIRSGRQGRQGFLMALFQNIYDAAVARTDGEAQSPKDRPS